MNASFDGRSAFETGAWDRMGNYYPYKSQQDMDKRIGNVLLQQAEGKNGDAVTRESSGELPGIE